MKKVFAAITIGLLLKVSLAAAARDHDSDSLGPDDGRMEDGNTVGGQRCCHSASLQGTIQTYPLNPMIPATYRFFYDGNNHRLAYAYDSDVRRVFRCSDQDMVCVESLIFDQIRQCFQTKHPHATLDDIWERCVPSKARRPERLKMGGGKAPLEVQMVEYQNGALMHRKLVGVQGCSPIADLTDVTGKGPGGYSSRFYFGLESKIRNKTVFDIPWFCTGAQNGD